MMNPNGTLMTPEQCGLIYSHKRSLFADEERAFYEHYWPCSKCKPRVICEAGLGLSDDYRVAVLAADIVMMDSVHERRQALIAAPDRLRDRIGERVQELWPRRQPEIAGQEQ